MNLAQLQREFLEAILAAPEPADERLAIYQRGARANHQAALSAAYPVVRRLVGEAFFNEAAARYGETFASVSGDLHAYGPQLAGFLAQYPHARGLAFLPDVARLEWAVHESRYAGEDGGFDFAALGAVPAGRLGEVRVRLRRCVRLVSSPHPVLAIWEANQEGRDGTPDRHAGPDHVVVRRTRALDVVPVAVEADGPWTLLQAFASGASLAQAAAQCEGAGQALEPALRALALLDVLGGFEAQSP